MHHVGDRRRRRSPSSGWGSSPRRGIGRHATSPTSCPAIIPMSIGMGLVFVPLTLIATTGVARPTPASPPACSTRPSRWAAPWAWRCSRPSPRTRRPACSRISAGPPARQDRLSALVDGFQVAYYGAIGLMVLGAIVLLAVLRPSDVAAIAPPGERARVAGV